MITLIRKLYLIFRVFYPELHPDLVSYWPLEESAGVRLHDISMYGGMIKADNIYWEYDDELKGNLLFTEHYQTFEVKTSDNLLSKSISCDGQCLYCSSSRYCKSCISGRYLRLGICTNSPDAILDFKIYKDPLEREYKLMPSDDGCLDPLCLTCEQDNKKCQKCIRNTYLYDDICYMDCPEGTFGEEEECKKCKDNCIRCTKEKCLECSPSYLLECNSCKEIDCGNGIVKSPEECDDGNTIEGDGCSSSCQIEEGFTCITLSERQASICKPICGDGKFYGVKGEECDDHNRNEGDGCDSNCKIEIGWWCTKELLKTSKCYCTPYYLNNVDVYSEDYSTLTFKFSKVLKTYEVNDLCYTLFGRSANLFGIGGSCYIIENIIVVKLGENNQIGGGMVIEVMEGMIDSEDCDEKFKDKSSRDLLIPTIPEQNVYANLEIEEPIVYCEDVMFWIKDIEGDLRKPLQELSITVDQMPIESHDHRQLINHKLFGLEKEGKSYYVIIEKNVLLPNSEYAFKLNITNFQGITYIERETLHVYSQDVLRISLDGAIKDQTITVFKSDDVIIRTIPIILTCTEIQRDYLDVQVIYAEAEKDLREFTNNRLLYFPAGSLTAGETYKFKVTSRFISNTLVVVHKEFNIYVKDSPIKGFITPLAQVISKNLGEFTLSSVGSFDRINFL